MSQNLFIILFFLISMVAYSFAACGKTHTVTLGELNKMMGRSVSDTGLKNWVGPLNTALNRYGMNCQMRIAAFLAQVRHETAGMTVFYQPRDNGAGTLHMTPANWQYACKAVPEIATAFASKFPSCSSCSCTAGMASNPGGADAVKAAKEIFSQPLIALLSGAWWFAAGAANPNIFGWKGCGDLRLDADNGRGGAGSSDCHHSGYYQVTCCIFYTIGGDAGLTQRLQYYDTALAVVKSWGSALTDDTTSGESTNDLPLNAIIGISIGVVMVVILLVVVVVVVIFRNRKNSLVEIA